MNEEVQIINDPVKIDWMKEVESTLHTFLAVFIGTLLATPLVNTLLGTDLPTIDQFRDLLPVLLDTLYRAAWITFLQKIGLYTRNTLTK